MAEESSVVDPTEQNDNSAELIQAEDEEAAGVTQDEAPDAADESAAAPEEQTVEDVTTAGETPADANPEDGEVPGAVDGGDAAEVSGSVEPGEEGSVVREKSEVAGDEAGAGGAEGDAAEGEADGEGGSKERATPAEGDASAAEEGAAATEGDDAQGESEAAAATAEGEVTEAAGASEERLPTSEGFTEGERSESPPRVSEKLSREPTPTADQRLRADRIDEVEEEEEAERPEPTSPDALVATFDQIGIEDDDEAGGEEEEEVDYEEEEVEEEEFNRDYMIASYKQAMQEREQKLHQNSLLQTKLSDYFRRKKADQGGQADASQETEKSITDQEQRYAKFLFNLDELRHSRDGKRQEFDDRIKDLDLDCESREEEVRLLFQGLLDSKRKIGLKSVSATNGRPFPAQTQKRLDGSGGKAQDPLSTSVDDMLQEEAALEDQVVRVRLDNIGLSNRVRKCETALKAKEELSEGLHMIDFEQLKIENQTYNEKIEERQEELLKLKKKITNNVQVLTHLKEKLQFVQCKKQEQCEDLNELDQTLSKRRDQLTRTKQIRDSLRNDNQRLKQNSGLLGNEALLRNFEDNVDLVTEKHDKLDQLKMEHSEMTLQCSKLKRKIDVARAQSAQ